MYKPIRWTIAIAAAGVIAGCTGSERITEPAGGRPSMNTGWGYGSGGRSATDSSTTTTQSSPASADTTGVL
jgi:hypothetical protein